MGTGSVGVLALYAHLRVGCHNVVAADYLPEVVALARRNADARRASIDIRESNLFAGISERFDVIAFNAPYLVEDVASVLGVLEDDTAKARFSGGTDGGETIVRFLADAPDHLTPDGKLLLGVNHYHVSPTTVIEAIRQSRLLLDGCVRRKITRAAVYILRPIRESGEPT
jgi:methylase of polypeptide subunit release factors